MTTILRTRRLPNNPRCVRCHGWLRFEDDTVTREWACLNCGYRGDRYLEPSLVEATG